MGSPRHSGSSKPSGEDGRNNKGCLFLPQLWANRNNASSELKLRIRALWTVGTGTELREARRGPAARTSAEASG
eukprot:3906723-Alexandrium_andersonii.AAC.1